jgi:cbb3-type cytochrome oxidase cytochrome c subunit
MTKLRRVTTWLTFLGLAGFLLGCNQTSAPPAANPPAAEAVFDAESGPFAAGKKVMVAAGCFRCHTVDGARGEIPGGPPGKRPPGGMKGGSRAPDLGKVGKEPEHTVEWFMAYIRNPKAQKPDAKMPSFDQGKINEEDLHSLAEYLASLK